MKKEKLVDVWKTEADSSLTNADSLRKEKKEKLLREVIVKIRLKQDDDDDEIVVKALLNSGVTRLVMSTEFVRKNKFKKKKLDRLIYMRNNNGTFNNEELIEHIVEVEFFYKEHKERMEINVIEDQK